MYVIVDPVSVTVAACAAGARTPSAIGRQTSNGSRFMLLETPRNASSCPLLGLVVEAAQAARRRRSL